MRLLRRRVVHPAAGRLAPGATGVDGGYLPVARRPAPEPTRLVRLVLDDLGRRNGPPGEAGASPWRSASAPCPRSRDRLPEAPVGLAWRPLGAGRFLAPLLRHFSGH